MFQISGLRFFLLVVLALSFGALWYLDTKYYHWDQYLPEPDEMVVDTMDNLPEDSYKKNATLYTKDFLPSNEWQTIEKDQSIPPGLHVKIDLSTGEKKAKLLDNKDAKTNSLAITDSKNLDDITKESKDQVTNIHKFKSYAALKDDLSELNMTIKTDIEIMDDLSAKFQKQIKLYEEADTNIRNILTDLEYLLHQIDTAEVFVKNKGLRSIIIPCLNSNSSVIKAQGALILGSAASNNQKVQIVALEANIIPLLLKHISDEYEFSVQKHCLYALSSISRRFPRAQKEVIDKNGIQIFLSIFKRPASQSNAILKLKVTQLLEDLAIEIEDAKLTMIEETIERNEKNDQLSLEANERVRQYNDINLKEKLVENGWCEILRDEFMRLANSPDLPLSTNDDGHAFVEASGKSLLLMGKLCLSKLQDKNQLYDSLFYIEAYYKNLSHDDDYFTNLYNIMNDLANSYNPVLE